MNARQLTLSYCCYSQRYRSQAWKFALALLVALAGDKLDPVITCYTSFCVNTRKVSTLLTLVLLKLDIPCLCKQCRSRSVGFWICGRPRWHSWMRRPTGDQEVAGSAPAEVSNILSWRLIMKYFLRSFSPFRWFKKGNCLFLAKECAHYCLTA